MVSVVVLMSHKEKISVLFVCLGNICRSPAAEGIFSQILDKSPLKESVQVDSCGLGEWHVGQLPDERMRKSAKKRGVHLNSRAREISTEDFKKFDYILAADSHVKHELELICNTHQNICLFTEFSSHYKGKDIPDPFYEDDHCFETVLDMLEDSCRGFLDHISCRS
jgi:protein-tyrosine phosphatase